MKKLFSIFLAIVILLSVAACGRSTKNPNTTPYVPGNSGSNAANTDTENTPDKNGVSDDVAGDNSVMPDSFRPVSRDDSVVSLLSKREFVLHGVIATQTYEYDSNGRILAEYMNGQNTQYQYTDEGHQVLLWEFATVAKLPEKISYENHRFNDSGLPVYYEMYRFNGALLYYFEIEYDSRGRMVALNRYTSKDYSSASFRYAYDEHDNLISSRDEGDPKTKKEYKYDYDSSGRLLCIYKKTFGQSDYSLIQQNTYDERYGLLMLRDNTEYEYNGYGQCDKISFDTGTVREIIYDESGNVISVSVYTGGDLISRYTYEYVTVDRNQFLGVEKDYVEEFVFENLYLEKWSGSFYESAVQ